MATPQSLSEHQEHDDLDESPEESLRRLAESDLPIAEDARQLLDALQNETPGGDGA